MRLGGRRVLVTGAASGIGLAIARLFRREGARVATLDRDGARLNEAPVEGAVPLVCDVADEPQVRDAVARAVAALGGLDGVVNSAGIDLMRPFEEMTVAEWVRVMAVDLTGPMLVCHAAVPAMKQAGRGTIIFDVLAPAWLGRAQVALTRPPARTVQAPGSLLSAASSQPLDESRTWPPSSERLAHPRA